jgi:tetratricopeptide (TPR) repeat protein
MSRLIFRSTIIVGFLVFIACQGAVAQIGRRNPISPEIHGQVRYAQGRAPADRARVRLEKFSGGIIEEELTDRTGKFRFTNLSRAQYTVTIQATGYQDVQQYIDLQTTLSQYLNFTLEPVDSSSPESSATNGVVSAKVPIEAQKEYDRAQTAFRENGKQEEGILHLEKAVKIFPAYQEAHLLLGTAYMVAQQWGKSEKSFRRAIEINSKNPEAHVGLGEMYRQQKKYTEAEKALLAALRVDSNSWRGHVTLGRVYWEMGKIVEAGPHVGKTILLKPDLAEAYLLGGNILLRAHKNEDALAEFEEYLRLEPGGKFAPQTRELVAKIKKALEGKKK